MTDSVDLLISGGTIVDGTGAPGRPGTRRGRRRRSACASSRPDARAPAHVGRTHRRHGQGRRPGLHRPPQPRRPVDPRRAAPRAQGPPGRDHRDRRRRRQRLRAVPPPRGLLEAFVELDGGLDGRPAIDYDWDSRRALPRALRRHGQRQRRRRSSATRRSASPPSAGTTCPPTTRALDRMRGLLRDAMAEGAVRALDPGSTTRPAATPRPRSSRRSPPRPDAHGGFYHTPRPLPARRPLSRPVPRGDRHRPARRRAAPHHPLLPPRDAPGPARADAGAGRRRPRRGPRRHLRHLSVRMGLHAPAHPAAAVDPGRRTGPAQGRASPTGPRATGCAPSSPPAARPTRARPAGRTSGSGPSAGPTTCAGSSRTVADVMTETGRDALDVICDLLLAEDLGVARSRAGRGRRRCRCSWPTRSGWSARTRPSSATSRRRAPTARSRGSSASSSATRRSLTLEAAIHKMTWRRGRAARAAAAGPAARRDAGGCRRLRPGDRPHATPPTTSRGSSPIGIEHVLVNGTVVVDDGEHTGATPGRGIRLGVD